MGRKIPGRKHHGVRDPEKQRAQRLSKIKDKINAPPSHPDTQDIPKSLARIIELKDKVKSGFYKKKPKKPQQTEPSAVNETEPKRKNKKVVTGKNQTTKFIEKPIPEFKQRPGETDKAFLYRVSRICQDVTREAAFENKYGVDIKRDPTTGEIEVVKRPKDELQVLINKAKKEKGDKKKKKKKKTDDGPKLTKSQKWQKKKDEKKKKNQEKIRDFDDYKDEVKFGEIAHAPPTLVAPRKVEKRTSAARPGNKELLLKSILPEKKNNSNSNKNEQTKKSDSNILKIKNKTIDRKGKRKDLPNALRRQLDKQQKEVIEAYKKLKLKKLNS